MAEGRVLIKVTIQPEQEGAPSGAHKQHPMAVGQILPHLPRCSYKIGVCSPSFRGPEMGVGDTEPSQATHRQSSHRAG